VIVDHDHADPCAFKKIDALAVGGKLRAADEKDVGLQRQNPLGIEDVVVVAPDRGNLRDAGERLREDAVFARAGALPVVLREADHFLKRAASPHKQVVGDVVGDDDAFGHLPDRHPAALDVREDEGPGSGGRKVREPSFCSMGEGNEAEHGEGAGKLKNGAAGDHEKAS